MYSTIVIITIFLSFFATSYIFQRLNYLPQVTTSSIGKRYFFIDGLRGIAAICVVVAHIWRLGIKGIDLDNYYISSTYSDYISAFGVQIFFCITGFLFFDQIIKRNATFDWEKFYLSRIKRLAPLFLTSTTISIISILIVNYKKISLISIGDLYNALHLYLFGFGGQVEILGQYSGVLTAVAWTLPFEWRFYLLLPLICVIIKNNKINLILSFVLMLVVSSFIVGGMNIWQYFLIGAFGAFLFNKIKVNNKIARISIFCSGIFSLVISPYLIQGKYDLYSFILVFIFFTSIVLSKPKILSHKIFIYTGEASYSIYLNHSFICVAISYFSFILFGKIELNNVSSIMIYSISSVFICILSFLSFKYIEYPFIKK
ncbi:acyltransferase family protein [Xenorhabdus bovienii]|uniref:Putative Acyltransferase 3 n=1 Tax=Xenorhabdus bovienii TaxID=40576 RepID=A0A0B6X8H1_XENBV|nr:acyltransferase [Xenorhabdus bovienii]CDM90182.1 putative Acyltransferase 3 [Xenorhabdus bovienii]